MYSTPIDLSFSYLRSAVEAYLDIKKVQMEPNRVYPVPLNRNVQAAMGSSTTVDQLDPFFISREVFHQNGR